MTNIYPNRLSFIKLTKHFIWISYNDSIFMIFSDYSIVIQNFYTN